jgi:predicted naringenin-chalcone synthase
LHHQYGWSHDRIVSNALFADGAGAVIVGELADSEHGSRSANRVTYRGNGSLVVPGTLDEMTWRVSDHGFEMTLSARVPDLIRAELRRWMTTWLSGFELDLSDISGWAIHPGGPRILSASAEALGLERSQLSCSDEVLAEFGNMSSPTVLFIVDRLQQKGIKGPIVMLAFGPGLTIEAALLG